MIDSYNIFLSLLIWMIFYNHKDFSKTQFQSLLGKYGVLWQSEKLCTKALGWGLWFDCLCLARDQLVQTLTLSCQLTWEGNWPYTVFSFLGVVLVGRVLLCLLSCMKVNVLAGVKSLVLRPPSLPRQQFFLGREWVESPRLRRRQRFLRSGFLVNSVFVVSRFPVSP